MKKIIVIGTSASGKSTLAKQISQKCKIPYVQLDQLFWGPNWSESSDEDFFRKIIEHTKEPEWVVDGNYARTSHLTWPNADTIIWIDLPFWLTLYQSFKRGIYRGLSKNELWPGTGNRESLKRFFSKDSVFLWMLKTYYPNRTKYLRIMREPKFSHLQFIHLKSRKEIKEFLEQF